MINRCFIRILVAAVLISAFESVASADDRSFNSVVSHIKTNYKAKRQGALGLVNFARFAVKMIRPAGFKNFQLAMFRDLDFADPERPDAAEFHSAVRSKIDPRWTPMIQYSSPREKQWNYVYVTNEKRDVKILVVALQNNQAFIFQTSFNPDRLIAFINDPKIMGISLKGDEKPNQQPPASEPVKDEKPDGVSAPPGKTQSIPIPWIISANLASERMLSNMGSTLR